MPRPVKICLINIGIAILFALLFTMRGSMNDFFYTFAAWLGPVSMVGGAVDLIVALVFLAFRKEKIGYGFLLSGGVLVAGGAILAKIFW